MNKSEKLLLKEMKEPSRNTELLSSIKKSVDPLGQLHGDFKFKAEIFIRITIIYEQLGVGIILPAALPANCQNSMPIFLFGLTDFQGGFACLQKLFPPSNPWYIANIGILLAYPQPWVSVGDLIYQYRADVGGNNYIVHIVVHCNNVSYGTLLNSFSSDLIILNSIRYSIPIGWENQFINSLSFSTQTLFGKLISDSIDPRMYITNQTFNQYIADIPVTLPIDKSLMIGTYCIFGLQEMNFFLTVQKVKPLTFH